MRNGAHWPSSGGNTIVGNSGVNVCVKSTTRMAPEAMAAAKAARSGGFMAMVSLSQLALERLRIDRKPRANVPRHFADEHVFNA